MAGESAQNQRWQRFGMMLLMTLVQAEGSAHCTSAQGGLLTTRLVARSGRLGAGLRHQRERCQFGRHLCFAVLHRHDVRPGPASLETIHPHLPKPSHGVIRECVLRRCAADRHRHYLYVYQSTNACVLAGRSVLAGTGLPFALARLGVDPANAGTSIQARHCVCYVLHTFVPEASGCTECLHVSACAIYSMHATSSAGGVWSVTFMSGHTQVIMDIVGCLITCATCHLILEQLTRVLAVG